ncbi:hypothetical protein I547_4646 [Mycobacterium kansasii 824]|nr:hypothetical protein I547_4646 [Mycobacterium kansasii 824]
MCSLPAVANCRPGGGHYQLGAPTLFRDENATGMPKFIRFMLRWVIKAPEFLQLDVVRELAPAG